MKKLLIILTLFLSSCVSYDQEILHLNFPDSKNYDDFGRNQVIELKVLDKRNDEKDLVGKKNLGEKEVIIKLDRNLEEVFVQELTKNLEENKFLVADRKADLSDKILTIEIIKFDYSSKRGFFVGESQINSLIKIIIFDDLAKRQYSTTKSFNSEQKHFISTSITDDKKIIYGALKEVFEDVMLILNSRNDTTN